MSKQRRKFFERARECVSNHEILGEILTPGEYRELVQPSNMLGESIYSFEWFSEYDHRVFTEIRMSAPADRLCTRSRRVYTIEMSFTDCWGTLVESMSSRDSIDQLPDLLDRVYENLRWYLIRDARDSGKEVLT